MLASNLWKCYYKYSQFLSFVFQPALLLQAAWPFLSSFCILVFHIHCRNLLLINSYIQNPSGEIGPLIWSLGVWDSCFPLLLLTSWKYLGTSQRKTIIINSKDSEDNGWVKKQTVKLILPYKPHSNFQLLGVENTCHIYAQYWNHLFQIMMNTFSIKISQHKITSSFNEYRYYWLMIPFVVIQCLVGVLQWFWTSLPLLLWPDSKSFQTFLV